jgi:hypothetical protein
MSQSWPALWGERRAAASEMSAENRARPFRHTVCEGGGLEKTSPPEASLVYGASTVKAPVATLEEPILLTTCTS